MENGFKDLNRDTESGEGCLMIHTLVNGLNQKLMDMVSTLGKMETVMKVNGTWLLNKVQELIFSFLATVILVNIKKVNRIIRVNILGLTVQFMLETSKKD